MSENVTKIADNYNMPNGTFFAVSTGAGNSEQITLEALRTLRGCKVIFYPETECTTIALDSLNLMEEIDLSQKTLRVCRFSMTRDAKKSANEYEQFKTECVSFLAEGKNVAFLSIGDVSLYSSAAHAARLVQELGFKVKFIAGVNSFSSAACSVALPLCERDESLTVIPADTFYMEEKLTCALQTEGTKVLMKMARHLKEIISLLSDLDLIQNATLVQKASLSEEKIFRGEEILHLSEEDFKNAYLSVLIVKNRAHSHANAVSI